MASPAAADTQRDLATVRDAIDGVEKEIKEVREIKRVEEALENNKPNCSVTMLELLMEKEKQLREEKAKLTERQQPGFAGGALITRNELERRLVEALGQVGARLDVYVVDKMVHNFGQALHLFREQQLVELYNEVLHLPRTATRQVIESKCRIRLNGAFLSGTAARCRLIVGFRMPEGIPVLLKVPPSAAAAQKEFEVCNDLWTGGEPEHLAGPMSLLTYGSDGFHTLDGAQASDMQFAGDAGDAVPLKSVLVMPKYASTLADVPVPHPPEFVLGTGEQIKEALEFMHERGYGHCDVKPSNIFMDYTGTRLLGDFGASVPLGKYLREGTDNFMPGGGSAIRRDKASAALDYFGLAVTLLFCCGAWDIRKSMCS